MTDLPPDIFHASDVETTTEHAAPRLCPLCRDGLPFRQRVERDGDDLVIVHGLVRH